MYESDNPAPVSAEGQNLKHGMSKVLLVSLIINAVLVVGIVVGVLIYQNKIDKIETDAKTTVNNARVQLVVLQKIADFRDKLGDIEPLDNINIDDVSYPYNLCQRRFDGGVVTKKAEVEKWFKGTQGPRPATKAISEDQSEYKFNYMFRSVTIIINYEGVDKVIKSIDYRLED